MTVKLPEWITKLENSEGYWGDTDSLNVIEALTIALEALESVNINLGIPLSEKVQPSYQVCIMEHKIVDDALARINALGEKD